MVLKTFLGAYMSPDRLAGQLRENRERAVERRAKLLAVLERIDSHGPVTASRRLSRASARYGVLQAEATITWTAEVLAELETTADLVSGDPGSADGPVS